MAIGKDIEKLADEAIETQEKSSGFDIETIRADIDNMLGIKHLSFSAVRTLMTNEQRFYRGYILGQRDEFKSRPATIMGNGVHDAIEYLWNNMPFDEEWYKKNILKKRKYETKLKVWREEVISKLPMKKAMKVCMDRITKETTGEKGKNVIRGKTQDEDTVREAARISLIGYAKNLPIYLPIAAEGKVMYEDPLLLLPIKMKIDLVARDHDNKLVVVDHKTVSNGYQKINGEFYPDFDMQGGLYKLGVEKQLGEKVDRVIFDQVLKGKLNIPGRRYQAELREAMEKAGLSISDEETGKWLTNDQMKEILISKEIIKYPDRLQPYTLGEDDFERIEFSARRVANDTLVRAYVLIKMGAPFYPNFFDFEDGQESYLDWLSEHL